MTVLVNSISWYFARMHKSLFIPLVLLFPCLTLAASIELIGGLYHLPAIEFSTPDRELELVGDLVKNVEIVALGEPIHTNGTFHKSMARIAKYLIEKKGFRVLTLETPRQASLALTEYLDCDKQITLPYALQRIFPQFASIELSELYSWVRQYNCNHPNDKVRFTGFDPQQNLFLIPSDEMNSYLALPYLEG